MQLTVLKCGKLTEMTKELKPVRLTKTETCLTYVLKRIGLEPHFCTYETFHEHFNQFTFSRYQKKLKIGDVLLWDKTSKWEWLPWSINGNGIIEWKSVPVNFHFAIVEGDGKFSDCTRLVAPPHPTLRLRQMKDLQKNPDFVLTLELNQSSNEN